MKDVILKLMNEQKRELEVDFERIIRSYDAHKAFVTQGRLLQQDIIINKIERIPKAEKIDSIKLRHEIATRFIGIKEAPGILNNPMIVAMLSLDNPDAKEDEIPWCSAFVNYIHWLVGARRSKSLRAKSWLNIGDNINIQNAIQGDVVVLDRSYRQSKDDPRGHVGFYVSNDDNVISILGGNQSDEVNIRAYSKFLIKGIMRIYLIK